MIIINEINNNMPSNMPSTAITTFTNMLYFPTVELIQNTPPTLILPHPFSFPHSIVINTVMLY